jgi:LruC domain-containing protein
MKTNKFSRIFYRLLLFSGFILYTSSCIKSPADLAGDGTSVLGMTVSPDFKFSTTDDVNLTISTLDNAGNPVSNIRLNVYTDLPSNGGALIISGATDENGLLMRDIKLPAGTDSLAVGTDAIGFVNMLKVKVVSGALNVVLGGKQPDNIAMISSMPALRSVNSQFHFLGTYNSLGVPDYLVTVNDVIDSPMLDDLNATLPEYQALTTSHPQYFTSTNETNLVLNDECNVWVTFVHEGAGYKNVMGFYKYNVNNPPATPADIDTIHIVFPNVSFANSGGGLKSGNKVYIGRFAPGTEIGWVLISNGFKGSSIPSGIQTIYSNESLNSEANATKRKHTILLNDIGRNKFLLSFEDFNREAGSDNDFNDAIFYITADPVSAIDANNIPLPNYTSTDTDKDGVSDNFDDYPADPAKAFNNFYPSQGNVGTLAFEDKWPTEGDYDFNDLVIDYNFNQITNGKNQVVQIKADITVKAIGAIYINGFGIQLPIASSQIARITGTGTDRSIIKNANGTEAGQSKAVVVVFDDAFSILPHIGYAVGVNTTKGEPYSQPKTLTVTIDLTTPVSLSTFGTPPYNPFIFTNGRSTEIHMIDNIPTDLADKKLFGYANDNSKPSSGRYYVTKDNLPFAIDIAGQFDYPVEGKRVTDAFLKFYTWGVSGGTQFYDWYRPIAGYRNTPNVFTH